MAAEGKATPVAAKAPEKAEAAPKLRVVRAWINPEKAPNGNYVKAAAEVACVTGTPVHRYAKTYVEDPETPWPRVIFHPETGSHVSPEAFKKIIEHPDVKFEWVEKGGSRG